MITYQIENRFGDFLTFDPDRNVKRNPLQFTAEKQLYSKQNQFGVLSRGSGKESSKKIKLDFDIVVNTAAEYYFELNRIASFLTNNFYKPFYLHSIERGVRAKISIASMKENFPEGLETKISLKNSIELDMEDALWEAVDYEIQEKYGLNSGSSISVELTQDTIESAPIIEIVNPNVDPITEFAISIKNGDFTANFIIANNGFTEGRKFTIDCANAIIQLGDTFSNPSLIAGNVFSLYAGTNEITYESPNALPVNLTVKYRKRVIF
ncbi:phage distal tail protein [Leptospira levettii]|uniref:phage distal tail protein n=1 Tax=Leptospira levettii TaxID=2023178 RepID=UPI000C2ABBD8|nr:phage tail family protein [Leptospira levettii]PJZ87938.1 hypothetical protein CH368_14345 [Leptospira levettii]